MTATLNTNATPIASEMSVIIPGSAVAQFAPGALHEHPAAVDEHRRAEEGRDPGEPGTAAACSRARAGSSRPRRASGSSAAARSRTGCGTSPRCGRRACRDRRAQRRHVHVGMPRAGVGRRTRGPNASGASLSIPCGLEWERAHGRGPAPRSDHAVRRTLASSAARVRPRSRRVAQPGATRRHRAHPLAQNRRSTAIRICRGSVGCACTPSTPPTGSSFSRDA